MADKINYDTATTMPSDNNIAIHNLMYKTNDEYRNKVNYSQWASKVDKPLQDSSMDMLIPLGVATHGLGRVLPNANAMTTVYHGTSPLAKQQIINNGINSNFTGQAGTLTDSALAGTVAGDASKGLVFTTESKWDAARYAASHDPKTGARIDNMSPAIDQVKKFGRQVLSYINNDGIVKMELPSSMRSQEVLNPEFKSLLEIGTAENNIPNKYQHIQNFPGLVQRNIATTYGNIGFGSDRVFADSIPTKFIVGSKDYNPYATNGLGSVDASTVDYLTNKYGSIDVAQKVFNNQKLINMAKKSATHKSLQSQQESN